MRTYLIHVVAPTLASLSTRADQQRVPPPAWKFEFPQLGARVALRDQLEERGEVKLHTGIALICEVAASDQSEALERATHFADGIASLICFTSVTTVGPCRVRSVIEVNPSGSGHPFRQFLYTAEDTLLGSLRPINEKRFHQVWQQFNQHPEQGRVARALAWLRKGLGMDNRLDEFIAYWVGLEVLKGMLRRALLKKQKDQWDGVRAVFPGDPGLVSFEEVKELRDQVLHGYKELDQLMSDRVKQSLSSCRMAFITAIGRVLQLPPPEVTAIAGESPRRARVSPYSVMEGEVLGPVDFEDALDWYPSVFVKTVEEPNYRLTTRGSIDVATKPTCVFSCKPGVRFKIWGLEQWGDPESGIAEARIDFPRS